jgi:hypothetical protein
MKLLPVLAVLALFCSSEISSAQLTAREVLGEAQQAYLRGDTDTARQKFKLVLEMDPKNVTAQNYLRSIAVQEKSGGGPSQLEKQLQALIVPHVEFKDATLGSALDYLKQTAAKVSDGKTSANFVVKIPNEVVDSKKVTLNLTKVPFTEVLRYLGELTGFKFTIDKYAITVKQGADGTAPEARPLGTPKPQEFQ